MSQRCAICQQKHPCPDPHYLAVGEALDLLHNLGARVFPVDGRLEICLPFDHSIERVAHLAIQYRSDFEWYFWVEKMLNRPRWGVSSVLRDLRGWGEYETARKARGVWRERGGDTNDVARNIVCRWMRWEVARVRKHTKGGSSDRQRGSNHRSGTSRAITGEAATYRLDGAMVQRDGSPVAVSASREGRPRPCAVA